MSDALRKSDLIAKLKRTKLNFGAFETVTVDRLIADIERGEYDTDEDEFIICPNCGMIKADG